MLSRWMAHYVAELIEAARNAPPEEKAAAEERCASAICALWAERKHFPDHARPFGTIGQLIATLDALDPTRTQNFWRQDLWRHVDEDGGDQDNGAGRWLAYARNLDFTARLLIDEMISQAAAHALKQDAGWVTAAVRSGETMGVDIELQIRLIEKLETDRARAREIKHLKDVRGRLDEFVAIAGPMRDAVDKKITALQAGGNEQAPAPGSASARVKARPSRRRPRTL